MKPATIPRVLGASMPMKAKLFPALAAVLLMFGSGCAAYRNPDVTRIRISGPSDETFTAKYRGQKGTGDITTEMRSSGPVTALDVPGGTFECEISRPHREVEVGVEFVRAGKSVYRTTVPAGSSGIRVTNAGFDWRRETF